MLSARSTLLQITKPLLDFIVGIAGSIVTLLITPIIAMLIKLEDGGPVFYAREFVDCDGTIR